ncbi:unnamed protein product [Rotaria sp. Silwood1]|nr:unnamed protein product [Rotaria sp. Silwood1]CAF4980051.1 unnamed protein product [Rotaria sp. Silwood1]
MGLCHSSNSLTIEQSLNHDKHLDIYTVVWLDNRIKKSKKIISPQQQQQLRTIINDIKIFENENDCEEYIKQMSEDEYIILIINDQIEEKFISYTHNLQQIFSIYIYSSNKINIDQQWINQYNKINSICLNYDELIKQIEFDQLKYKYINNKILFDIFHIDKLNDFNDKFIYSQIFIDILLQLEPMPNDMNNFIILCRNQYKGNKFLLNILHEFQKNYTSNSAIWWFTRDTFISQILNKALRTQNIELIFLLRFFIHDIEQQLKQDLCLTPIKVYRFELLSNKELELLKNSIGQFISINNFLLTKLNRELALSSSKISLNNNNNNDFQSVLFEITGESNLDKIKPFSYITLQKFFHNNNEEEILFMLGSIFQIKNIYQNENNLWIIEMILSSRTNSYLKSIFKNYINDNNENDDEIDLLSFGCILQKMNKLDEAKKYYSRLLNELSEEDERIPYCLLNLGNIEFIQNNYHLSLEWLLKSLDISLRTLKSNDILFARIYYSMGHVYNQKNDIKLALESYDKAIIIWKQSIDDYYLNIAECMNNIGIIYKNENNYLLALECFKKTLIILEKYVSNDDFDISKTHCNIASTYRQLGQYDLALEHYNLSFKILQKCYSLNHPNIAKALGNIGIVHALKGERPKALLCYEKAAEIYRHTLPPTHINNIKIEQLIRNLSSPHRKLSFGPIETR